MKKKLTFIFVLMMIFVLVFAFVGCDKKEVENVETPGGETGGDETGGDETGGEEEVSTALANSEILGDALSDILEEGYLNISVKDFEFTFDSNMTSSGGGNAKGSVDVYLRKNAEGYDFKLHLNFFATGEDTYEKDGEEIEYTSIDYIDMEVVYVGGYIYMTDRNVDQIVIDGVPYGNDIYSDDLGEADAKILTYPAPAWEEIDEYLGNTDEENSRVDITKSVEKVNTLQGLLTYATTEVPVLKELGIDTVGGVVAIAGRLFDSVSGLVSGETEAGENGSRELSVTIDPTSLFEYVVSTLEANMDKTVGEFIDTLLKKDPKYVAGVVNKLFPAEGKCLTVNQFIAGVEEVLAENGVEVSFKAIVDEVQEIAGLTTQQIADIVNPILEEMLPGTLSISINPKDGETLYDTLERTVFDMIGVDTILGLISPEEEDPDTGEVTPALTGAMINEMVNGMIYGEEGMTVAMLLEQFDILSMIPMMDLETAKVELGATFDADNKLSSIYAALDFAMKVNVPAESEGVETEEPFLTASGSATATFDYSANDSAFDVSGYNVVEKQITVSVPFEKGQGISYAEIVEKAEITVEEGDRMSLYEIYNVDENGYVDTCSYNTNNGDITLNNTYDDLTIIAQYKYDGTFYFVTLVYEAPATEA